VREERAAMRDVLKARRENPETPEEVRPRIAAAPVSPSVTPPASAPAPANAPPPTAMDSIAPNEPVERAAVPARTAVATAAPPRREVELPRARPATIESVYVPAPPPGLPPATASVPAAAAPSVITPNIAAPSISAPSVVQPAPLSPVVVSAAEPPPPQMPPAPPVQRGPVGVVLSTLSSIVGHAANATGDTVNWVIDLPGKAVSAGGRVIGVNPSPPPPPVQSRPFS
jgi:hypothetical protein